jgi:hypothetical protein
MRAELFLSCFYNPIRSGSRNNPIILRNYRCIGIGSTKKRGILKKIQRFFGLAGILGKRSVFSRGWGFLICYTSSS